MELSEKEFKEIYDLIKKGFVENGGLNILDFERMKEITLSHGYIIDDNLNIVDKTACQCIHKNKILTDIGWVCVNCKTILSRR